MPILKQNNTSLFRMVAKTLFGLESILEKELISLGAKDVKMMIRSVEFYGDQSMLYRANLYCRTAVRILKPIVSFKANTEDDLYRKALSVRWDKYLRLNQTFAIDAVVRNSGYNNSLYVAQKTKDAIADYFRKKKGERPSVDIKNPDIRINCYISNNNCTLAIDSSGEPLFKRGYRAQGGKAPLNEVLAAGILLQSSWNKKQTFVDAMCGSGTIVIEAAMMARNMATGLNRKQYGFMNWPDYDRKLFESLMEQSRDEIIPSCDFDIVGADINSRRIDEAKANAELAGVGSDISFKHVAIADFTPPSDAGVVIINPPYGERMSMDDVNSFYHSIGDAFKKQFTDYDAYVFTGNFSAAKHIGLRTSQRIELYNGPIECRLLKFEMYKGSRKLS